MIKLKFKSLTMRIWTIFTLIILVIICSISLLYFFAFRTISEKAMIEDLKVAHDILLKSNDFKEPTRFDELKNLRGSEHFILNITNTQSQIIGINRRGDSPPLQEGHLKQPPIDRNELRIWMTSFIKGDNLYLKQFKETYNNEKYIFIVSSIDNKNLGKSYLITYIPSRQDNGLLFKF
jgi:two-component system sensor histidine kinase CssS